MPAPEPGADMRRRDFLDRFRWRGGSELVASFAVRAAKRVSDCGILSSERPTASALVNGLTEGLGQLSLLRARTWRVSTALPEGRLDVPSLAAELICLKVIVLVGYQQRGRSGGEARRPTKFRSSRAHRAIQSNLARREPELARAVT